MAVRSGTPAGPTSEQGSPSAPQPAPQQEADRGRWAERPGEIPAKGWKDVAVRVAREVKTDNMGIVAAGVAFFSLLALFPALLALVSVYGLVVSGPEVQSQIDSITDALPSEAAGLLVDQVREITSKPASGLGLGLVLSVAVALWTASGGTRALIKGLNIAYDEQETRKFFKLRGLALLLTLGGILLAAVVLAAVVALPAAMTESGSTAATVLSWLRWPVLAVIVMVALALVYRYGPDRDQPRWSWVSWGAGLATVLWLVGSVGFSVYVANFGKYNQTYGTLGAAVVLMLWLALSVFVVLLGAEVNAEMERQTARDTTKGPERPLGQRDAYAADSIGEAAGS